MTWPSNNEVTNSGLLCCLRLPPSVLEEKSTAEQQQTLSLATWRGSSWLSLTSLNLPAQWRKHLHAPAHTAPGRRVWHQVNCCRMQLASSVVWPGPCPLPLGCWPNNYNNKVFIKRKILSVETILMCTYTHTHISPISVSHSHTHTHTHSPPLCLSFTHTHSPLSVSHTHTHTHTHTHSPPSLSLIHPHTPPHRHPPHKHADYTKLDLYTT